MTPTPSTSDLAGRTVVVTGAGTVGQVADAVARAFAAGGARVVLVGRDERRLAAHAAAIAADGHPAPPHHAADLTDERAVAALVAAVTADGGAVHALVNVAGGFAESGPVAESDPAVLAAQLAMNVTTAYLATRAFLPALRATRGSVVFFGSTAALPGAKGAGTSAYAVAKSGVLALMRAVAAEERERGVRANAVAPGSVRTGHNEQAMGTDARYVEREAVAEAVLFLCSPAARGVSGEVVRLE